MKKYIISIIICMLLVTSYIAYGERFYTPKEVVASVICAEGIGEGYVGLYAISNVIANRSKKWNKTPYEIVIQENQFYGYTASNKEKLYMQGKEICDSLSERIIELDDITNGALYFRRVEEKKKSWHLKFCIKIKNHLFYK